MNVPDMVTIKDKGLFTHRRLAGSVLFLLVLTLSLTVLPVTIVGRTPPTWAPESLRNWAFDLRLAIAPLALKLSSVAQGSVQDDRVHIDRLGRKVTFQSEGLTLVGTLYEPEIAGKHPGILLLHGSTPEGRNLGLYRVLGGELAERGYVVLNIDRRGYGESNDPSSTDLLQASRLTEDVRSAFDFLGSLANVNTEQLYIIGHSGGADIAITAGIEDEHILKMVAIGPSRRVQERAGSEDAPEWAYFQRREMRYMKLSQPIPAQILRQYRISLPLENHMEYFLHAGHKPLMLIDGALESEQDRMFLKQVCQTIAEPKQCVTLAHADHYANVANLGSIVIYDQRVTEQLVNEIDAWLSRPPS
jgi:pimeloyl-ACP methyl ester carboxylesterase